MCLSVKNLRNKIDENCQAGLKDIIVNHTYGKILSITLNQSCSCCKIEEAK